MSIVKDTTNLKPYKVRTFPAMDDSMPVFLARELLTISTSLNQCITALKALEARIVVGGL